MASERILREEALQRHTEWTKQILKALLLLRVHLMLRARRGPEGGSGRPRPFSLPAPDFPQ